MRQVLPAAPAIPAATAAAEATAIGLLGLADITASLAPDRFAEPASLEELLFTSREREALPAVFAGQFLVLGH